MVNKQEIDLYGGEIKMVFYPDQHWYKIGKEFIPSVTSITGLLDKPHLVYRAANMARDYLMQFTVEERTDERVAEAAKRHTAKKDEAADIGGQIHNWIEQWIANKDLELPKDDLISNGILAFLQRVDKHNVKFEASEQLVYSKKHNYCGTFDAIAEVDGKRYLIDFKSSNGFYPESYGLQLAAYLQAYAEETNDESIGMMCIRFDKTTGGFEAHDLTGLYDSMICAFNCLVQLRHAKKIYDKNINALYPKKKK